MYKDKTILITGGTGSWGNELVRQLLKESPKEVRIFSRGEQKQVEMQRAFKNDGMRFIIGDIRDRDAVLKATGGVDYVFHLAALKHVPICEIQPDEAIKTNILGTENLIKACIQNKVAKVIDVSTDKAVDPLNLYGMTKAVGERLMIQANQLTQYTKFICIRAGNVLGSNGSVVPFFKDLIKRGHNLTLTHSEMSRYFMTLPEAIQLLFKGVEASYGGEIFVMRMPAYYIRDIAEVLIEDSKRGDTKIINTGMRSGEKLYEVLISRNETLQTYQYDDSYYVILPTIKINGLKEYYEEKHLEKVSFKEYTSKDNILGKKEVYILLRKVRLIH